MVALVRPEAEFLRQNAALLNELVPRRDALLFLPFGKWVATNHCAVSGLAATLTRANVQYSVICEDDLNTKTLKTAAQRGTKVLLLESTAVLAAHHIKAAEAFQNAGGVVVTTDHLNWSRELQHAVGQPSIELEGPKTLRAVVCDQPGRVLVHLLNLNVQRQSSFEDHVEAATNVVLTCRVPLKGVRSVSALSADAGSSAGPLVFRTRSNDDSLQVQARVPRVELSVILLIEQ
jgi:hypothetical protein